MSKRSNYYYWELVVLARLVATVILSVFVQDTFLQSFWAACLVVAALVLHLSYEPFEDRILNILEAAALISVFTTQMGSLLYYFRQDRATEVLVTLVLMGVNLLTIVMFALCAFASVIGPEVLAMTPWCGTLLVRIFHRRRAAFAVMELDRRASEHSRKSSLRQAGALRSNGKETSAS